MRKIESFFPWSPFYPHRPFPQQQLGPACPFSPAQAPPVSVSLPSPAEGARNRTLGGAALFQAPSRRRVPRPRCTKLRPRQRLPPPGPFLATPTSAQCAQDCTLGSDCPAPSATWAPHPPPRVQNTAPSTTVTAALSLSRHPNLRQGRTKPHLQQQLPPPRHHLGDASFTQGARNRTLGSGYHFPSPYSPPQPAPRGAQDHALGADCPTSGAALAPYPAPGVSETAPSAQFPPPFPLLAAPISAQGARNCTFGTDRHRLPLFPCLPPPSAHGIALSTAITPSQAPSGRRIFHRGSQYCAQGSTRSAPGAIWAPHSPPRVHKIAPSTLIAPP